ncbi:ACT domain-containing protein [[Clostridium] innocuum]|nr:ACT domain-containing protein [[Clostridium] innocuum]
MSEISTLLAKKSIGIFAISTYNTDYILMKEEQFENAVRILAEAGYRIL